VARSIEQTEEVRLLAALCRELAKQGLDVGMSDAKPAVSVRRRPTVPRLWIIVDACAGVFEWGGGRRHAVGDPAGTAARIAADVRCWISSEK
jgi:hypothetical protein